MKMNNGETNKIIIKDFDSLIDFFESHDLNENQINEILIATLRIISVEPFPKKKLIEKLKAFWEQWGGGPDWPLFLESDEYDI